MRNDGVRTLKERKELERQRELKIEQALTGRDKALETSKRDKKRKKRTVDELLGLLNLGGMRGRSIRETWTYVPKSYNLDRQLVGLLNHLFVRYPVPTFLYQACVKQTDDPFASMHDVYRQWFASLAQGGSFPKLVKGFMTGREAFTFLSAPAAHRVHENVWWAKMRVAGLPDGVIEKLIERIFGHYFFDDPDGRLAETIQFYARFHGEMDRVTFGEITDYIVWKLRNDRSLRLRGRTVASVVKLTNEWQVQMQKARLGRMIEWEGLGLADWVLEAKDRIWTVTELLNNRELLNEGRKQKHCVYSYVSWCQQGRSAIFSMRAFRKVRAGCAEDGRAIWDRSIELTRVTVEVSRLRAIVQVRGLMNRPTTDDENNALRQWAGEKGLVIAR